MAKKKEEVKSLYNPNCRYCSNAGDEFNYMCFCRVLNRKVAVGIWNCSKFNIDFKKYQEYELKGVDKTT